MRQTQAQPQSAGQPVIRAVQIELTETRSLTLHLMPIRQRIRQKNPLIMADTGERSRQNGFADRMCAKTGMRRPRNIGDKATGLPQPINGGKAEPFRLGMTIKLPCPYGQFVPVRFRL